MRASPNGSPGRTCSVPRTSSSSCSAPTTRAATSTRPTRRRCGSTTSRSSRLRAATDAAAAAGVETTSPDPQAERELLAAYGENALALRNIPLGSGTVSVQGSGIPANHSVWVAGRAVPVDARGNFAAEEILPTGAHTVEVAVVDDAGNGNLYLRDLEFKRKDTFYVGVADFTLSENRTNGPAELLQGANAATDLDSPVDGRLAFYLNTEFGEHWNVTASADTREGPVEDLFSNFLDKSRTRCSGASTRTTITRPSATTASSRKWPRPWASSTSRQARARTTRCGAISRSATWATSLARSIAGSTAPTRITRPSNRPGSASGASPSTASRRSPAPWRATSSSAAPADRSSTCAIRTSSADPSACASSCATRFPASSRASSTFVTARTTTSTTCRAACCCPSRCRRRQTTICWCAAADSAATRHGSWSATSSRRGSTSSMPWRSAARATTGSTTT